MTKAFVPIGLICSWPVATNPLDWFNSEGIQAWFDCNGQTFNTNVYPDLYRILGRNTVPDLRGLFLRCQGGNAGALLQYQGDAIRNIYGSAQYIQFHQNTGSASGAFYLSGNGGRARISGSEYEPRLNFDASRVVPTANENRPVNTAVRFIIRAVA